MEQRIGFRRNIYREWLDATAAICLETSVPQEVRSRLDAILAERVNSVENRRIAIDILLTIWLRGGAHSHELRSEALSLYQQSEQPDERLWLHYGMTLLAYPFFRLSATTIGQLLRYQDDVTLQAIRKRVFAELGQTSAIDKALDRVLASLRDWNVLCATKQPGTYTLAARRLTTNNPAIERWLLAAVLAAHPAEELPFADLVRLPELFPFRLTIGVDDLRHAARFEVQRQGLSWDMVRLVPQEQPPVVAQPVML